MPRADTADDDAARRTARGRVKMLLVLLACAAPVIASYFTFYVVRPEGRSNYATLIAPAREMPAALPLTDLDGRAVSAASLKGQWLLVVVGGGACDATCEQRLYLQRQLREMTGRERDRIDKLWLVTDDAPIAPVLRAALAAAPATQVLRVPAPALAQWLAPAAGEVARIAPVRGRPDGPVDDARAAAARPGQAQARHREAAARVEFLGPPRKMTAPSSLRSRPPRGAQAAWERPGAGLRSIWR